MLQGGGAVSVLRARVCQVERDRAVGRVETVRLAQRSDGLLQPPSRRQALSKPRVRLGAARRGPHGSLELHLRLRRAACTLQAVAKGETQVRRLRGGADGRCADGELHRRLGLVWLGAGRARRVAQPILRSFRRRVSRDGPLKRLCSLLVVVLPRQHRAKEEVSVVLVGRALLGGAELGRARVRRLRLRVVLGEMRAHVAQLDVRQGPGRGQRARLAQMCERLGAIATPRGVQAEPKLLLRERRAGDEQ